MLSLSVGAKVFFCLSSKADCSDRRAIRLSMRDSVVSRGTEVGSTFLKEALWLAVRDCWLLSFDVFNANGLSFKVELVRLMPAVPNISSEVSIVKSS